MIIVAIGAGDQRGAKKTRINSSFLVADLFASIKR